MNSSTPISETTMQAIVQDRYGEALDVLRLEEVERPAIGDDEVLVRVRAAGLDRGVWHVMAGLPYPVRLAGYGVRKPKNRVRGREVAGRVEAVGKSVTAFRVGDEVFGIAEGSFAEYARADEKKLAPKPKNLTFAQAAASTISALTALQGVRDKGEVQPGHKVLVIGASGGVGTFAVQIAKALGAEVTGVAQCCEGRHGAIDRRRPCHRLHEIRHHRQRTALRRDPRHRRQPHAQATPPRAGAAWHAGHHGWRDRRQVHRRLRPRVPGDDALTVRRSEAALTAELRERCGPARAHRAHRSRQGHPGHRPQLPAE